MAFTEKKQEHMNRTDAGSRQKILTALCSRLIYIIEKNKTSETRVL